MVRRGCGWWWACMAAVTSLSALPVAATEWLVGGGPGWTGPPSNLGQKVCSAVGNPPSRTSSAKRRVASPRVSARLA